MNCRDTSCTKKFCAREGEWGPNYNYTDLIDIVEEALQTAVQGAVKREDEQEFALHVNGQNLMFCEDAARRVKAALEEKTDVFDYVAEFSHVESIRITPFRTSQKVGIFRVFNGLTAF